MNLYESKILLVDDEPDLLQMVGELLKKEGYVHVDLASDCCTAKRMFGAVEYHMVLLDVMLPDGDGFTLFDEIRRVAEVPVIFLSARDEDTARLKGLGLGADDYITKPFLPQELLLRIRAVLRRTYHMEDIAKNDVVGDAVINWSAGMVQTPDSEYLLTAKEYVLLKKLCENRGRILSINTLCDTLWPDGSYGYENSLMVHIRRLREKLEKNPSKPEHLLTARGLGYKLV